MRIEQCEGMAAADNPVADAIGRELAERLGQALGELAPREAEVFCFVTSTSSRIRTLPGSCQFRSVQYPPHSTRLARVLKHCFTERGRENKQ